MPTALSETAALVAPPIWRRLACLAYEGVLLFGVIMVAGLVYGVVTQQRHALAGSFGLKLALFIVLGLYFVHFWTHKGQTLAMLTWHIRLVTAAGAPVSRLRACCRYLLAWIWFLPALATAHLAGLAGGWPILGVVLAGVLAYAALARLHPQRQFLHDALCGTRLVHQLPVRKQAAAAGRRAVP